MNTITRGLMFVVMAVGVAILFVAVSRRERPRRMRASDPRPSDFVEAIPHAGNGHGNGHGHGLRHEACEEF